MVANVSRDDDTVYAEKKGESKDSRVRGIFNSSVACFASRL